MHNDNDKPVRRLLDEYEVEARTGRKVNTLRSDRSRRRGIPFIRIGRSVKYDEADVERFIDAGRVETAAAA